VIVMGARRSDQLVPDGNDARSRLHAEKRSDVRLIKELHLSWDEC
jgi:hypothetical protein